MSAAGVCGLAVLTIAVGLIAEPFVVLIVLSVRAADVTGRVSFPVRSILAIAVPACMWGGELLGELANGTASGSILMLPVLVAVAVVFTWPIAFLVTTLTSWTLEARRAGRDVGLHRLLAPTTEATPPVPWVRRDRHLPHPELLHRGAHRPREVDAGRPPAGADPHGRGPRHARAVPGQDGSGARAGHHDQGAGRAAAARGVRAEPDRHARSRGLHVRGLAVAGGVRGRRAARRCGAGHRGADAGELPPGARRRPGHRARAQQDRPAGCGARRTGQGARRPARPRSRGHPADLGEVRRTA